MEPILAQTSQGNAALNITIGLVAVFFIAFPILVNGLIAYTIAQILGERSENQAYARGEGVGDSRG